MAINQNTLENESQSLPKLNHRQNHSNSNINPGNIYLRNTGQFGTDDQKQFEDNGKHHHGRS